MKFQSHIEKIQEIAKRHEDYFPRDTPLFMQVLKGHLLVEELARALLTSHLPHPGALVGAKGASLTCHQAICVAEALLREDKLEEWVWEAMKKLNTLRNRLAHKLSGIDLEKEVDSFTRFVTSNKPDLPDVAKDSFPNARSYFEICIMEVSVSLSTIDFWKKTQSDAAAV